MSVKVCHPGWGIGNLDILEDTVLYYWLQSTEAMSGRNMPDMRNLRLLGAEAFVDPVLE